MNEPFIDEVVSTARQESMEIGGQILANPSLYQNGWITAQCEREAAAGDFEVHLEQARIPRSGAPRFRKIGTFNQVDDEDDDAFTSKVVNFPVNIGSLYRFRHVSGEACWVSLGG